MKAERITEDAHYHSLRVRFPAYLGPSRVMLQIDIGFGDIVLPEPELVIYPTLLELPTPRLLGYSRESTIAEKLEAMVSLGMLNSRVKDYYDIWYLSRHFGFRAADLTKAIHTTFDHRGTPLPVHPTVVSGAFADEASKTSLWIAFRNRAQLDDAPVDLREVIDDLQMFLLPILRQIASGEEPQAHWSPPNTRTSP